MKSTNSPQRLTMRCSELARLSRPLLPASAFPPTAQRSRQPGESLSLGSLGVTAPVSLTMRSEVSTSSMTYSESHRFYFRSERRFPARRDALSVRCS